jgi:ribose transport system ATP-binding protein
MTSLRILDVSKRFGATIALKDVSVDLMPGMVYGILGENGSGKSTLVKILSGVLRPDQGVVQVGGRRLKRYSPAESIAYGVATAHQEVLVAKNLSVLDNLFLWDRGWRRGTMSISQRREAAEAMLKLLCEEPPPLNGIVGSLSLASQQTIVIARAILQHSSIVILDEATSALDAYDAERVLKWVEAHAKSGGTVLFISHRLGEVTAVADEILVLREGAVAGRLRREEATRRAILALMSPGRRTESLGAPVGGRRLEFGRTNKGNIRATVKAVKWATRPNVGLIDLEFEAGEVTGLAGLDGHGQAELLKNLSGWVKPLRGHIEVLDGSGNSHVVKGAQDAARLGIAYVPRDRKSDGILPTRSVLENFGVANWDACAVAGILRPRRLRKRYDDFVELLSIKSSGPRARITSLSGGSQQKVVVARWLARNPRVLLLDDPTRGVDQATKADLYGVLRRSADTGSVVVLVSTDAEELAGLCDRVVVFHRGSVTADLRSGEAFPITADRVVSAMFGESGVGNG